MNLFDSLAHVVHIPWVYLSAIFAALVLLMAGLSVRRAAAGEHDASSPDEPLSRVMVGVYYYEEARDEDDEA